MFCGLPTSVATLPRVGGCGEGEQKGQAREPPAGDPRDDDPAPRARRSRRSSRTQRRYRSPQTSSPSRRAGVRAQRDRAGAARSKKPSAETKAPMPITAKSRTIVCRSTAPSASAGAMAPRPTAKTAPTSAAAARSMGDRAQAHTRDEEVRHEEGDAAAPHPRHIRGQTRPSTSPMARAMRSSGCTPTMRSTRCLRRRR
jgi:hypothetical protein